MNAQLADAFAREELVRPMPEEPSLVHLVRALGTLSGAKGLDEYAATQSLMELIGPAEHYVFVVLDGLGMNILRQLSADSFLATHLRTRIQSSCPSTTASALTSVATGQWPAQHAVTGWFTHLPEFGLTATILPFTERYTQKSLTERGLTAQSVMPVPAFYAEMSHRSLTLLPRPIVDTAYATYSRGYTPGLGYTSVSQAVDAIADFLKHQNGPTHVHLYVPDIDTACHKRGVGDPYVYSLIQQIDAQLTRLAGMVPKSTRIVVTADHGLIDVPLSNHLPIFPGDPLLELLEAPPSGDARMPLFHVRPTARQAFVDLFQQRYAHSFTLLSIEEAEELELFGPKPWAPVARRRFGDFVGVAVRPATLLYHPPVLPTGATRQTYLAQHAGLSPDEMYIPLILA
jgi:hypothetical protein